MAWNRSHAERSRVARLGITQWQAGHASQLPTIARAPQSRCCGRANPWETATLSQGIQSPTQAIVATVASIQKGDAFPMRTDSAPASPLTLPCPSAVALVKLSWEHLVIVRGKAGVCRRKPSQSSTIASYPAIIAWEIDGFPDPAAPTIQRSQAGWPVPIMIQPNPFWPISRR